MAGEPVGNRIYTIYTQSGKVFDVWNGLKSDNTIVWTYTYNGDMCQEWKFIFVSETEDGKCEYVILTIIIIN